MPGKALGLVVAMGFANDKGGIPSKPVGLGVIGCTIGFGTGVTPAGLITGFCTRGWGVETRGCGVDMGFPIIRSIKRCSSGCIGAVGAGAGAETCGLVTIGLTTC